MSDLIKFNTFQQAFGTQTPKNIFKCSGYGLSELIKDFNNPIGLEIGCDIGDTTEFLLSSKEDLNLISIDPYENYVDWNGRPLNEREEVFNRMMERMKIFNNRFTLIRKTSDDAVVDFHEEQFDFIFIDGLHTYDQLSKDCENYYKFLKPGGIFSGHDFTAIEGVNRAANEFATKVNKEIMTTECDVWYWYK
jgi:SAM-dependent methyltransferase